MLIIFGSSNISSAWSTLQDLVLFALSIGWNKHNHRLAHDFFGGVSEEALRTLIPGSDGSLEIDAMMGSSEDSTMARRAGAMSFGARLLDVRAVCERLGGSRPLNSATVYRAVAAKLLPPPVKFGRISRWRG
jgi:predicted DNA-binding transcriptional regulator AlpA